MDDEANIGSMMELLIPWQIREAIILTFQNRDTAWQALLRSEPDLLITNMNNLNVPGRPEYMGRSGRELLPQPAE